MTAHFALLRERWNLLRLLSYAPWGPLALLCVVVLSAALTPAGLALAIGIMVSRVSNGFQSGSLPYQYSEGLLISFALVALLLVVERVLVPINEAVRHLAGRDIDGQLRTRLLNTLEKPAGISHLERSEIQNGLHLVRGGLFGTAGTASVAALTIVGRYIQTLASLAIVAWFSLGLALVVLLVILGIRRRWHRAFGQLADALVRSGSDLREVGYTVDLALTPPAAKELRIFGLLDWFLRRAARLWGTAIEEPFAVRRSLRRSANIELALLATAYALTFVVLARAAVRGEVSIAVVAAILQAAFSAAQLISPTAEDFATGPGIAALRAFQEVTKVSDQSATAIGTRSADDVPAREVCFESVSFTYPGSDISVLDSLDLRLNAGESLALVGLNGAGKTTLVRLLCALYAPTAGRITVDGISLEDFDPRSWRRRMGVIFQDFIHYDLTARENVALGALDNADDIDLLEIAADKAGATTVISQLPFGWDTVLSRQYEGGTDLSGGEWQRIALARALFAVESGAGLLVLDEPTANLDVRAEAQLFDQFLHWTRGMTVILISHRFSTVRRADRIAVLEGGRVIETGSHEQLIAAGGRYSETFRLQAAQFADPEKEQLTAADMTDA